MPNQMTDTVARDVHTFLPLIVANGLNVLGAIAILIVGLWVSSKAHALIVGMLGKTPHLDPMLIGFSGGIVRYLILTITVLAVLSQFGIQTTSFVAVLGAAGLAVGLALQGTLSNLAAGVMLLIFRPFRIGQSVQVGGIQGTVKELSLFWTELVTGDNVQIIVPNGNVWGQPLKNFSFYPVRAVEVHFPISESMNLDHALTMARSIVETDARVVANPAPGVSLDQSAADNSLEMVAKVWTSSGNLGAVKTDLIKVIREHLNTEAVKERAQS
jgi:small conductance mechanosensitive channel